MGRGVPEMQSTVIENNFVILNLRYAVAYRAFSASSCNGAANV